MKQVAQRPRDGGIVVVEVPAPMLRPGWALVQNHFSLISAGTERSKVTMGQKNLVQKARARPDLVRTVVDKALSEGVRATVGSVKERLDGLEPLGYSSSGVVLEVGQGVEGLRPGDRVACGGGGWASHAEIVSVPRNLIAPVPDGVPLEAATYATVGAVALHGVRQAEASVGEHIGVIGLGLVGQLTVRILLGAGCRATGIDPDPAALELARQVGVEALKPSEPDIEGRVQEATAGLGLDAVIVCAAASSADPVQLAARLARDRGRLVIVGAVPVEADRSVMYDKELELRLARSYGPGRYDRDYEERGRDLPVGYVRWTEQRNMAAFVDLLATGAIDVSTLTTHSFKVDRAADAYAALAEPGDRRPFGVLLEYPLDVVPRRVEPTASRPTAGPAVIGMIGAGSFGRRVLIPALTAAGAQLDAVHTQGGLSAADVVGRFGFRRAASSAGEILEDPTVRGVVIATRHADHAALTAEALRRGKHVLVEKPLALDVAQLDDIEAAARDGSALMVGFNRRFAPLVAELRAHVGVPRMMSVRVNAGALPDAHWLNDLEDGGGRLAGEGCHFVDLIADLGRAPIRRAFAAAAPDPARPVEAHDDVIATLELANGSVGVLAYTGSGSSKQSKERIEVFAGGISAVIDDFRRLEVYAHGKRTVKRGTQDKGHRAQVQRFVDVVAGRSTPPPLEGYLNASRATLALLTSLRTGQPVDV